MLGYLVRYRFKARFGYSYQRFFRALYGYTQVVKKSNGKTYIYRRKGVLTNYPYIHNSKNTVIIPPEALSPLVTFFKTGKNPCHEFEDLSSWNVSYYIEQVNVDINDVLRAVIDALKRIRLSSLTLYDAASLPTLSPDDYISLLSYKDFFSVSWVKELRHDPYIYKLYQHLSRAQQMF